VHENPTLDKATIARAIGSTSDIYRAAREFGTFVNVGGLIYPDFERCVVKAPFDPAFIRTLEVVVSIDPGIRNAGIVSRRLRRRARRVRLRGGYFRTRSSKDYVAYPRGEQAVGPEPRPCLLRRDPAARQRSQVDGQTVISALAKEGVYCNPGQNDHETGFDQMRTRMQHGRIQISPECRGLRDEADDYAARSPRRAGRFAP
jgi:hypothetical protein